MSGITEFCTTYSSFSFYKIHCWVLSIVIDVTSTLRAEATFQKSGEINLKKTGFPIFDRLRALNVSIA